jgi:7-cyano-7-deazaguanine synthase
MVGDSCSCSNATVLLSGGIDSTACLAFFLEEGVQVKAIFVDYGQAAASREAVAAKAVCTHFGISLYHIRCVGVSAKSAGLIVGRNAFLILAALMEMDEPHGLLAVGIHAGTNYWDCSADFVRHVQAIIDGYTDGRVRLSAPFLDWAKADIWRYCVDHHVPTELTYSCQLGLNQPCGSCLSCRDLEALHVRAKFNS